MPEFEPTRSNEAGGFKEIARSDAYMNWLESELASHPGMFISTSVGKGGYINDGNQEYRDSTDKFFELIEAYALDNYIGRDGENDGIIVTFSHNEKLYNATIDDSYGGWFCSIMHAENNTPGAIVPTFQEILTCQKTERAKDIDYTLNDVTKAVQSLIDDKGLARAFVRDYLGKLQGITQKPRVDQEP
jgi:hypothetical protein